MGDAPPKTAGKATYASTQSSTQDCRRINTAFNPPTRYHQLENGVANYGHPAHTDLIVVYFGPQTAKNRTEVLTHPTGSHHAGHCHASSCYCWECTVLSRSAIFSKSIRLRQNFGVFPDLIYFSTAKSNETSLGL